MSCAALLLKFIIGWVFALSSRLFERLPVVKGVSLDEKAWAKYQHTLFTISRVAISGHPRDDIFISSGCANRLIICNWSYCFLSSSKAASTNGTWLLWHARVGGSERRKHGWPGPGGQPGGDRRRRLRTFQRHCTQQDGLLRHGVVNTSTFLSCRNQCFPPELNAMAVGSSAYIHTIFSCISCSGIEEVFTADWRGSIIPRSCRL